MTASLWVPGPLPGMNELIAAAKGSRGTGRGYSRIKRQWTETVWALAKAKRLPKFERARFVFTWVEKHRRRDPDNIAAGGRKLILDGLVKAGVIPGDGWAHVAWWSDAFTLDSPAEGCGVMVFLEAVDVAMGTPSGRAVGL